MSSVFLAKVEMKEKEEKDKLKNSEIAGGNKESKRMVISLFIMTSHWEIIKLAAR